MRRAPAARTVAVELLQRLLDAPAQVEFDTLYRDPQQDATQSPARIPPALAAFAEHSVLSELQQPRGMARALGEWLSEPKDDVVFDQGAIEEAAQTLRLDRRTRMLYDAHHVFINGESYRAAGRDAALLRRLADRHAMPAADRAALSKPARLLVDEWVRNGWLRARPAN